MNRQVPGKKQADKLIYTCIKKQSAPATSTSAFTLSCSFSLWWLRARTLNWWLRNRIWDWWLRIRTLDWWFRNLWNLWLLRFLWCYNFWHIRRRAVVDIANEPEVLLETLTSRSKHR